jgi:sodium transport system ATP-binding protein
VTWRRLLRAPYDRVRGSIPRGCKQRNPPFLPGTHRAGSAGKRTPGRTDLLEWTRVRGVGRTGPPWQRATADPDDGAVRCRRWRESGARSPGSPATALGFDVVHMLTVDAITKSFRLAKPKKRGTPETAKDPREDGGWFHAVRDVSFKAEEGAILGLLGPNGAGKTTLLRVLSTALEPTKGTARFGDVDIVRAPVEVRRRLGFLSGNTGLYGRLTPRELLAYFGRLHGMERAALERRIETLSVALDLRTYLDRRCDTLSAGMKQKVSIARTLVHDPEIVVFDEPTTGLDVAAAETILRLVERCKAQGKTVLLSTHHMSEVERVCDQVVVIHEGKVRFSGTVPQMRTEGGHDRLDRAFLNLVGHEEVSDGEV